MRATKDQVRRNARLRKMRERFHARRRRFADAGLTSRGTPRIYAERLPVARQRQARRRYALKNYYVKREQFLAAGLTTIGNTRRRKLLTIPTEYELAWRAFRSTILTVLGPLDLTPAERGEL